MAAANKTDDFFGVGMAGANPYANQYQPVHNMAIDRANTQAKIQNSTAPANAPGAANQYVGGQLNSPQTLSHTNEYRPSSGYQSYGANQDPPGYIGGYMGDNGQWVTGSPGTSNTTGTTAGIPPGYQYNTTPPFVPGQGPITHYPTWNGQGGPAELGATIPRIPNGGSNADSIPQDLATLREYLQNYYLGALNMGPGRYDPSFTKEELTVPLDPSWGKLNDTMYNQLGLSNQATGTGLNMLGGLYNQGASQADLSQWQGGAGSAMNAMLSMGQRGGNWNPEYQNMLFGGQGTRALNAASMNPSMVDPNLRMMAQNGVGMGALQNMAMTGGRGNLQPQLDAIRTQGMQGIEDQLAQIREQYGAMGLGAGSDIADALGRGASRGYADIIRQQSELAFGADEAASGRMLQAGGMEQGAMAGLMNSVGQLNLGGQGQSIQAGGMMNDNILGMGGLWNQAQGTGLNALQGVGQAANYGGQMALSNAQLGEQHYGTQAQIGAAYTNNPYASNMGQLTPGLGMYPNAAQQNATSNLERWYGEQLRYAMGPPLLGAASQYAGNVPGMPGVQPQSHPWMNVLGTVAGAAVSTAPYWGPALFGSSRDWKEDIDPADNILGKLKTLPMFTWRYKGDPVKHIGPMAQDFQETFGIGDGQHLHFGDMLSVIMGGLKEMANASN